MTTTNSPYPNEVNSTDQIRDVKDKLSKLERDIEDSYYRIPKQDFESVTVAKISKEVSEQTNKKLNTWRNWMAGILGLLSLFGYKQFTDLTSYYSKEVEKFREELKEFKQQSNSDLTFKIEKEKLSLLDKLNNEQLSIRKDNENMLASLAVDINKEVNNVTQKETEKQLSGIRGDISFAKGIALKTELDYLSKEVEKDKKFDEGIYKAEIIVERAIALNEREIIEKAINHICLWTFSSLQWSKMDKLRSRYEKEYNFSPDSWANFAIADMFLYAGSNSKIYRKRALEAFEKSLEEMPDYGTPHAVRLIIYMIDYERENNISNKERIKDDALYFMKTINNGANVTSYEIIKYLNTVESVCKIITEDPSTTEENFKTYSQVQSCLINLYNLFPEEMKAMDETYLEYKKISSTTDAIKTSIE